MQHRSKPLLLAILLPLVVLLPSVAAEPQENLISGDRHVFVWRGQGGQLVEIATARGPRGFLGINLIDLTAELRQHFGVPVDRGVMISRILADSPAQKAGLEIADIVTAVGGRTVSGEGEVTATL